MNFGLDKAQKILYGNSNLSGNINMKVNFRALDGKTNFDAATNSNNGKFKFETLSFESGSKIKEGKYQVIVEFILKDWNSKLKNFIAGKPQRYRYEGVILLFAKSSQSYVKKMKIIGEKKQLKKKRKLINLKEKVKTLDSLMVKLTDQYKKNFREEGKIDFKRYYLREISPLLQALIIDEYNILTREFKMDNQILKMNREFYLLTKRISEWSFEIINEFKAVNEEEMSISSLVFKKEFIFKERIKTLNAQIIKISY